MRNPLQTKEWVKEIIKSVSEWNEKHKKVLQIHPEPHSVHDKNCIRESEQKITRHLRRIVLNVARAHLRHESIVKPNDLKALFGILEDQKKEIQYLSDTVKVSKDRLSVLR